MPVLFLVGRILFGGFFVYSGLNHFLNLDGLSAYAAAEGVPLPTVAVVVSGVFLLAGGLSVILGTFPRVGALLLVLFLVPAALVIHDFWTYADEGARQMQRVLLLRNTALTGAALLTFGLREPWPLSLMSRSRAQAGPPSGAYPSSG